MAEDNRDQASDRKPMTFDFKALVQKAAFGLLEYFADIESVLHPLE
jgi:hypothetical protein